jgi:hypothetical protein
VLADDPEDDGEERDAGPLDPDGSTEEALFTEADPAGAMGRRTVTWLAAALVVVPLVPAKSSTATATRRGTTTTAARRARHEKSRNRCFPPTGPW